jgi:hypothetical protein
MELDFGGKDKTTVLFVYYNYTTQLFLLEPTCRPVMCTAAEAKGAWVLKRLQVQNRCFYSPKDGDKIQWFITYKSWFMYLKPNYNLWLRWVLMWVILGFSIANATCGLENRADVYTVP